MLTFMKRILANAIAKLLLSHGSADSLGPLANPNYQSMPETFGASTTPYLELDVNSQTILGEYVTLGGKTYRVPHAIVSGGGGGVAVTQGAPGPCASPWPMVLTENGTDVCVKPGDFANKAVRVNVVAGGSGFNGGFTDHSGVTPDALSNVVAAANATRHYLMIQNISDDTLWVNFGVAAVTNQPSIRLRAGAVYIMESSFLNTASVNLIGAAGLAYVIKEG